MKWAEEREIQSHSMLKFKITEAKHRFCVNKAILLFLIHRFKLHNDS